MKSEMETTHTPGPWRVETSLEEVRVIANCEVCAAMGAREPITLANIARTEALDGDHPERRYANAALIAVAPELYEALNGLFGLLQMIAHRGDITPDLRAILVDGAVENHRITTARSALLKATPQVNEEVAGHVKPPPPSRNKGGEEECS